MMKILVSIVVLIIGFVVLPATVLGYPFYEVYFGGYDHLKKEKILEILSKETTLFYSDGQTQLGSLFGTEHRQYVPLKQIPKHMLDAIVAAEDDGFYRHSGVDFLSTLRALYRNVILRKREGASTITQQTVKNLYGRTVTNYLAKYQEAINSFKLERLYTKNEILEFYLNQFHVTGNGHGIGVAAKYYFDKETADLTVTESAFISGSVKGPERYNPFTKRTAEAQAKARSEAKIRKNYVLKRMLESKYLSLKDYEQFRNEEVPFLQGKFQFNELFVTDIVMRQLGRKEILKSIEAESVNAIAGMGLRITTTLNKTVQLVATYGVRQNLSRIEMILNGFVKEPSTAFVFVQKPEKYGFYTAKLTAVDRTPKSENLTLSFGIVSCQVPTDGIDRVAKITDQSWYRGLEKSKKLLLGQVNVGDLVLASVREVQKEPDGSMRYVCDLERRPKIQGALMVLDKGKVISMVGGYSPHEYNRAVFAKRQPGSTFKTMTYAPALQLGWNALEPLLNVRSVYTWQNQFYYPRPDHAPTTLETTFFGAGSHSENLASVYLLARLLEKVTPSQFKELLESLEIVADASNDLELQKVAASKFNVKLSETNLKSGIFEFLRSDMAQDVMAHENDALRITLRSMNYGHGFETESAQVASRRKDLPVKEKNIRLNVLKNSFLRWKRLQSEAEVALKRLVELSAGELPTGPDRQLLEGFAVMGDSLAYLSRDHYVPSLLSPLLKDPEVQNLNISALLEWATAHNAQLEISKVKLDGVIPVSIVQEIGNQIQSRYDSLQNATTLEKLFWHDDFRYSLGMIYAQKMVHSIGVESEIQWVPSFPLGANVVTLAELSLAYQSMLDGKVFRYFDEGASNQILVIERIEDSHGNLLWEANAKESQVLDSFYSPTMLSILHGTVTNGTAHAAYNNVVLRSSEPTEDEELKKLGIRVPIFGKTGTTNDYVNATYVGFLPYPEEEGTKELSARNAYTIASYVGYDSNEPMKKRGFKIAGGTGALPAWIETASILIKEQNFAKKLNWKELAEKKVKEVPFELGAEVSKITIPIHSSLVQGTSQDDDASGATDLNSGINDYSVNAKEPLFKAWLPGSGEGTNFAAKTKVSFFKAAKAGAIASPSSTEEIPAVPAALNSSKEKPAQIQEDKVPEDEVNFEPELPPMPKDL
jgi:penicillin-binding protein 1A